MNQENQTDINRRIAARTVAMAVGGVCLLVFGVFYLTGRFSDSPERYRRPQLESIGATSIWYRLEVSTRGPAAPFFLGLRTADQGVIINGSEEIPVSIAVGDGTLTINFPHYDTQLNLTLTGRSAKGVWMGGMRPPSKVSGVKVVDPLPERRYPKTPDIPSANGNLTDFSHVWLVEFGGKRAKVAFHQTDTGVLTGAFVDQSGDTGVLTGRVFGRLAFLSRFDGSEAVAVTLAMNTSEDGFAGTYYRNISAPVPVVGRPADRVEFKPRIREYPAAARPRYAGPELKGPAVVALLDLDQRASHELVEELTTLHDEHGDKGLEVVAFGFVKRGGDIRAADMTRGLIDQRAIRWSVEPKGDGTAQVLRSFAPGALARPVLPALLFVDSRGAVTASMIGFWGRAATHDYYALRDEIAERASGLLATD